MSDLTLCPSCGTVCTDTWHTPVPRSPSEDEARTAIEAVLDGVHVEDGRRDSFRRVVDDLLAALRPSLSVRPIAGAAAGAAEAVAALVAKVEELYDERGRFRHRPGSPEENRQMGERNGIGMVLDILRAALDQYPTKGDDQ